MVLWLLSVLPHRQNQVRIDGRIHLDKLARTHAPQDSLLLLLLRQWNVTQSSLTVRSNIPRSHILVTAHKHISLSLYHHLSLKHLSNKLGVFQSPCRTAQEQISI